MKILGISAFYHDAAAALIVDNDLVAAAQEERFSRIKHDPSFPSKAIRFCLEEAGLEMADLDAVVFYDKPWLKFERLMETYYFFAPKGLRSFISAMTVWIKDKFFMKRVIRNELRSINNGEKLNNIRILFNEHHLSHAASAFYASPYKEAAILTIDGVGEWATTSMAYGDERGIKILKEIHFPNSLGLLYSAFTYYLGFKVNSGEYKLMGLAPYGNADSYQVREFVRLIKEKLINLREDGSFSVNNDYFNYMIGLTMTNDKKWEELFGVRRRRSEEEIIEDHCSMALAIQRMTEEIILKQAREMRRITGTDNLCLAGGVALNCVANGLLQRQGIFNNIFIQPAAGDAGGALGAAWAANFIYFKNKRVELLKGEPDYMKGALLGPSFSDDEALNIIKKFKPVFTRLSSFEEVVNKTAEVLKSGGVVGWFQGKMEFGPRALGNRSILGDPRDVDMQRRLNLKIKYRESFRPFAPSVLAEDVSFYFDTNKPSPYMLLVDFVNKDQRMDLPDNYLTWSVRDKLYFKRSKLPAVAHVDFSARIQTVHRNVNEKYWQLLSVFKEKTGCGVLVNTSFNVRGEPIVCTPLEAYTCFMRTDMDYLVIGNLIFNKEDQLIWKEKKEWKEEFVLD